MNVEDYETFACSGEHSSHGSVFILTTSEVLLLFGFEYPGVGGYPTTRVA
jgi:hypothetical protein